ncbi:unnamed protein product [Protopolystoma xenopodis]|uniref:ABC transmembrane type-1 domain-containing protein n=1 Tax=Protopolystoma xenopodis TaxID=117903 RepID=A0A448XEC0_9PLAT|nr:unnamed protein product [Protopolystoma xenopodis]
MTMSCSSFFYLALFIAINSFALASGSSRASYFMHKDILLSVLHSPSHFFDTTPLGRIINRFSKDIDTIDLEIPMNIRLALLTFASVIASLTMMCFSLVWFPLVLLPLSLLYFFLQRIYVFTSRQLKRIDSVSRSPIYSHFQETLNGVASIRAYRCQKRFIGKLYHSVPPKKSNYLVDENIRVRFPLIVAYRWLGFSTDLMGAIIVLTLSLAIVATASTIGPGFAGLAISFALQGTSTLAFVVRTFSDIEMSMVSVERIEQYSNLPSEVNFDFRTHPSLFDSCILNKHTENWIRTCYE